LERVAAAVQSEFGVPVGFDINYGVLTSFYDPSRRQYNANGLIKFIHEKYGTNGAKTIGLFQVDLFIPILTFVIGQAVYKGNVGIVSLYRLKNELYGLKEDENLLFERFCKEIIHELGHTFGLTHCTSPVCVMRSSTYIEEVDEKNARFCATCKKQLDQALNEEPL
jgi:archaemetzincin